MRNVRGDDVVKDYEDRMRRGKIALKVAAIAGIIAAAGIVVWMTAQGGNSSTGSLENADTDDITNLVEFGDFNCRFCAIFATEMLPELRREFIDDGKLGYEFRHFPFLDESSWRAAGAGGGGASSGQRIGPGPGI